MLFQTQFYVLVFLPAVTLIYYAVAGSPLARQWVLVVASLVFYGWWDVRLVALPVIQIVVTWLLALASERFASRGPLIAGIAVNLLSLGTFKYLDFLLARSHRPSAQAAAPEHRSAHRHQLLYVPADLLSGRPTARGRADLSVAPFRSLRAALSAPDRRPDRASQRAGAAVRARSAPRRHVAADRPRPEHLHDRLCQKGAAGGPTSRVVVDPLFANVHLHALNIGDAWTAVLAFSFQLFLDFSAYTEMAIGIGADLRPHSAGEFSPPVSRDGYPRFLAALAHHPVKFPARLSLHSARRQPPRSLALPACNDGYDGSVRTVARRGMDLRSLGPVARTGSRRLPWLAASASPPDAGVDRMGDHDAVRADRWVVFRAATFADAQSILGFAGGDGRAGRLAARRRASGWPRQSPRPLIPSAHEIINGLKKPLPLLAAAGALLAVFCLFKAGEGAPVKFIYFQF